MTIFDMSFFKKKKEDEAKNRKRRSRKRLLESRDHVAWMDHHNCDYCNDPIMGGMWYERKVFATFWGIRVEKRHLPECPEDWLREEEKRRQVEEAARKKAA